MSEPQKGAKERKKETSQKRLLGMMALLFALVHGLYYASGVTFDAKTIPLFAQFLDPALLRDRLWESLVALHCQPPLFNLLLGVTLKIAPHHPGPLLQGLFLMGGFTLYVLITVLLQKLQVGDRLALLLSTLFLLSPSFVLYEHWLFYTFPEAVLMTLGAWTFYKAVYTPQRKHFLGFFCLIAALCLLRSLFHLVYFVLMVGLLVWQCPAHRKQVALMALLPFLLVVSLYVKNSVLFGKFTASTWTGMNFSDVTLLKLTVAERDKLISEGKLSAFARIRPFSPLRDYAVSPVMDTRFVGVPALVQRDKPSGVPNYNNLTYIALSDKYLVEDIKVIRAYPRAFWRGIFQGWKVYFEPSTHYYLLPRQDKVSWLVNGYDTLLYGKLPWEWGIGHTPYLFLLLGLPFVFFYGLRQAWKSRMTPSPHAALLWFLCLNILYVALIGNTLESGENNRFRFTTDPLSLLLAGVCLQHLQTKLSHHQPKEPNP